MRSFLRAVGALFVFSLCLRCSDVAVMLPWELPQQTPSAGFFRQALYVSVEGDDSNDGSQLFPLRSISFAIEEAQRRNFDPVDILIGSGTYSGPIALTRGVRLRGGIDPKRGWEVGADPTIIIGGPTLIGDRTETVGVIVADTDENLLSDITVSVVPGPGGFEAGASAYGILATRAQDFEITRTSISVGFGVPGQQEISPSNASPGNPGGDGGAGAIHDAGAAGEPVLCDGILSLGRGGLGGQGGIGGMGDANRLGDDGEDAQDAVAGGAGIGGTGGTWGEAGFAGRAGAAGADGAAGRGGLSELRVSGATVLDAENKAALPAVAIFLPSPGEDASPGENGGGGGGGGGGGTPKASGKSSGGGGGGGSGGCGGLGGRGGGGGGGACGILALDSVIRVSRATLTTGDGGAGASGASGASGGAGGRGGNGGTSLESLGGRGGDGGAGGRGGQGGGGAGGPSIGVVEAGISTVTVDAATTTITHGRGGAGGFGDAGGGQGADGIAAPFYKVGPQ